MTDAAYEETDLELIDGALADLGSIHRRAAAQTLPEADFRELMTRVRTRLRALRLAHLGGDEPVLVLTDAGAAAAVACAVGQKPEVRALLRRIPALMTAQQLADSPGVSRARFYGPFAAIDGGRP